MAIDQDRSAKMWNRIIHTVARKLVYRNTKFSRPTFLRKKVVIYPRSLAYYFSSDLMRFLDRADDFTSVRRSESLPIWSESTVVIYGIRRRSSRWTLKNKSRLLLAGFVKNWPCRRTENSGIVFEHGCADSYEVEDIFMMKNMTRDSQVDGHLGASNSILASGGGGTLLWMMGQCGRNGSRASYPNWDILSSLHPEMSIRDTILSTVRWNHSYPH